MSYNYRVLADNPIGYWDLVSITSGSINDLTTNSNNALVSSNVSISTPPIVINSGSALKISLPTASVQIDNKYDIFNNNSNRKIFVMEFWLSFNGIFTGNGYATNNTSSGYYNNNQLNIIKAVNTNTGSTLARVYYDYNTNTLRYNVPGSNNLDSHYYIEDMDKPFHIVATYNSGKINLLINGKDSTTGFVNDFSNIKTASSSSLVKFIIDGSSINSLNSSSPSFILNNLAFYNYNIDTSRLKNHMRWGMLDDAPNITSTVNSLIDYINPVIENKDYILYKSFSGKELSSYKTIFNLVTDNAGLGTQIIDNLFYYKNNSDYYINSSSGVFWSSSSNYLYFKDFGKFIYNNLSIFMTVSSSVVSSNQTLFSITNVNGRNTFYLKKNPPTKTGYYAYYFDEMNGSSIFFASLSTAKSSLSVPESIGISFDSNNIYLYGETASVTSTIPETNRSTGLQFSAASQLVIGENAANNYASATIDNTSFYSYLGFYNDVITSHVSMSATYKTNPMFLMPLISDTSVNQYGYSIYEIETGTQISPAYGSFIKWNTPDNLTAKISYDNGSSWANLTSNLYVTNYNHSIPQEKILLKFEFNQNFSASSQILRMNNLEFGLYDDIFINSDALNYKLSVATSSAYNTYSIKSTDNKIIHRPENFGISFKPDELNFVPSYAIISTNSASNYGLDLWMRIDSIQANASNVYLINTSSYSLYYTASNPVLQWASATNLIPNPSFEVDTSYVGGLPTTPIRTNEITPAFGSYVGKITSTGAGTIGPYFFNNDGNRIPVLPNKIYTFSIYVRDGNSGIQYRPSIEFYSVPTGGTASTTAGSLYSISTASWTRINVVATSPAGATYAAPTLYGTATVASQYFYFDAAQLELGSSPTQYNDSSLFFVYINGASVANKSFLLKQNEYYHVGISNVYPLSGSININGGLVNNGVSANANATYGYFSLWGTAPSSSDIQNRYNIFVSNNTQAVTIQDNNQFIRTSAYYDTASAFQIG